ASKGPCPNNIGWTNPICQTSHTFTWDNLAFDGPFTYRDYSFDAPDALIAGLESQVQLGKRSDANMTSSWSIQNLPENPQAAVVRVLFNHFSFIDGQPFPTELHVTVNGNFHNTLWPYPPNDTGGFASWRTLDVTIPLSDLVTGTNTVLIGADQPMIASNVNIVLVDVPGGLPSLPGVNNAYPGTTWSNITGNLSGMASECGNLTKVWAVPNSSQVLAGVALHGLWVNETGTTWEALGTGSGSAVITHRPWGVIFDPSHAGTFWVAGFYDGTGGTRYGVHKTTNGGTTFSQLGTITINDAVAVDLSDPDRQTLLAGGHEQQQTVYRSTNGGDT